MTDVGPKSHTLQLDRNNMLGLPYLLPSFSYALTKQGQNQNPEESTKEIVLIINMML